jgi:hypothetical protein
MHRYIAMTKTQHCLVTHNTQHCLGLVITEHAPRCTQATCHWQSHLRPTVGFAALMRLLLVCALLVTGTCPHPLPPRLLNALTPEHREFLGEPKQLSDPEPLTHAIPVHRATRSHEHVLDVFNSLKARAIPSAALAQRFADHRKCESSRPLPDPLPLNSPPADNHPALFSMSPLSGSMRGGTRVVLRGRNLAGGSLYKCLFGNIVARAALRSPGEVECRIPRLAPSANSTVLDVRVVLAIISDDPHKPSLHAEAPAPFRFYSPQLARPKATQVDPLVGPTVGGTLLRVRGHFLGGVAYNCRFGERLVPAVLLGQLAQHTSNDTQWPGPLLESNGFLTLAELRRRRASTTITESAPPNDGVFLDSPPSQQGDDTLLCISPLHVLPGQVAFTVEPAGGGGSPDGKLHTLALTTSVRDSLSAFLPQQASMLQPTLQPLTDAQERKRTKRAIRGQVLSPQEARGLGSPDVWDSNPDPGRINKGSVSDGSHTFEFFAPFKAGVPFPTTIMARNSARVRIPLDLAPPNPHQVFCHFQAEPSVQGYQAVPVAVRGLWDDGFHAVHCVVPPFAQLLSPVQRMEAPTQRLSSSLLQTTSSQLPLRLSNASLPEGARQSLAAGVTALDGDTVAVRTLQVARATNESFRVITARHDAIEIVNLVIATAHGAALRLPLASLDRVARTATNGSLADLCHSVRTLLDTACDGGTVAAVLGNRPHRVCNDTAATKYGRGPGTIPPPETPCAHLTFACAVFGTLLREKLPACALNALLDRKHQGGEGGAPTRQPPMSMEGVVGFPPTRIKLQVSFNMQNQVEAASAVILLDPSFRNETALFAGGHNVSTVDFSPKQAPIRGGGLVRVTGIPAHALFRSTAGEDIGCLFGKARTKAMVEIQRFTTMESDRPATITVLCPIPSLQQAVATVGAATVAFQVILADSFISPSHLQPSCAGEALDSTDRALPPDWIPPPAGDCALSHHMFHFLDRPTLQVPLDPSATSGDSIVLHTRHPLASIRAIIEAGAALVADDGVEIPLAMALKAIVLPGGSVITSDAESLALPRGTVRVAPLAIPDEGILNVSFVEVEFRGTLPTHLPPGRTRLGLRVGESSKPFRLLDQSEQLSASAMYLHPPIHALAMVPSSIGLSGGEQAGVAAAVFTAAPMVGPASGASRVVVRGFGLAGGRDYMCRFGEQAVPATFHSGWDLPAELDLSEPAKAWEVALGARDADLPEPNLWTSTAPHSPPQQLRKRLLQPGLGAPAGHSLVACLSPPAEPGPVPFAVSTDGGMSWARHTQQFHYVDWIALQARPTQWFSLGGTVVTIQALSLQRTASAATRGHPSHPPATDPRIQGNPSQPKQGWEPRCRFGASLQTPGSLTSSEREVACLVPSIWRLLESFMHDMQNQLHRPLFCNATRWQDMRLQVQLELSLDGGQSFRPAPVPGSFDLPRSVMQSVCSVLKHCHACPSPRPASWHVLPRTAPLDGSVRVSVAEFHQYDNASHWCLFGDAPTPLSFDATIQSWTCASPTWASMERARTADGTGFAFIADDQSNTSWSHRKRFALSQAYYRSIGWGLNATTPGAQLHVPEERDALRRSWATVPLSIVATIPDEYDDQRGSMSVSGLWVPVGAFSHRLDIPSMGSTEQQTVRHWQEHHPERLKPVRVFSLQLETSFLFLPTVTPLSVAPRVVSTQEPTQLRIQATNLTSLPLAAVLWVRITGNDNATTLTRGLWTASHISARIPPIRRGMHHLALSTDGQNWQELDRSLLALPQQRLGCSKTNASSSVRCFVGVVPGVNRTVLWHEVAVSDPVGRLSLLGTACKPWTHDEWCVVDLPADAVQGPPGHGLGGILWASHITHTLSSGQVVRDTQGWTVHTWTPPHLLSDLSPLSQQAIARRQAVKIAASRLEHVPKSLLPLFALVPPAETNDLGTRMGTLYTPRLGLGQLLVRLTGPVAAEQPPPPGVGVTDNSDYESLHLTNLPWKNRGKHTWHRVGHHAAFLGGRSNSAALQAKGQNAPVSFYTHGSREWTVELNATWASHPRSFVSPPTDLTFATPNLREWLLPSLRSLKFRTKPLSRVTLQLGYRSGSRQGATWSEHSGACTDIDLRVISPHGSEIPMLKQVDHQAATLSPSEVYSFTLSPSAMSSTPIPFPLTLNGRLVFDHAVRFDLSQATGIDIHRYTVLYADPVSGMVVVRCVDALRAAGVRCSSSLVLDALRDRSSPFHNGLVGFNAIIPPPDSESGSESGSDNISPLGGHPDGSSQRFGRCSNPVLHTKRACLNVGTCTCEHIGGRHRDACESQLSVSGQPCQFFPLYTWNATAPSTLADSTETKCSDPRFGSKEACLSAGHCSDPRFNSRSGCLAAGVCVPPPEMRGPDMNSPNRAVLDYSMYRTREECEQPSKRAKNRGRCRSPTGAPPSSECSSILSKQRCVDPFSRPTPSGSHRCVRKTNGPEFPYTQFSTRELCEEPRSRNCIRIHQQLQHQRQENGQLPMALLSLAQYRRGWRDPPEPEDLPDFRYPPPEEDVRDLIQSLTNPRERLRDRYDPIRLVGVVGSVSDQWDDVTKSAVATSQDQQQQQQHGPPDSLAPPQKPMEIPSTVNPTSPLEPDCGPAGVWVPANSLLAKGPKCDWVDKNDAGVTGSEAPCKYGVRPCPPDSDTEELEFQEDEQPGEWIASNDFASDNSWEEPGSSLAKPCPCDWQSNEFHLRRCNWWHCGPPVQPVYSQGTMEFARNKADNEHISDYNIVTKIGGDSVWVVLDSTHPTTWLMGQACFTEGCKQVKIFTGSFYPATPPVPSLIDFLEAGVFQLFSMTGMSAHTTMNIGGTQVNDAPFLYGFMDLGTINPMAFNHSGAIGFGNWEENWPWLLLPLDPMLSVLDYMRTGSVFYPIPMVPLPIPKPFPLWAFPPVHPAGYMYHVSFFFGDSGGCFFLNSTPRPFRRRLRPTMDRIALVPMPSIKFLSPSWMFMVGGLRVEDQAIRPCLIPAFCRGQFATSSFSIGGPLVPALTILEAAAAPLTCEHIEILPSVTFTIQGRDYTMQRQDYTIVGFSFDSVQCVTAFTPMFQLIPGMDLWQFGDTFIRAFYLQLQVQPTRSAKIGLADQPYYEKNGCSGRGKGPVAKYKPEIEQTFGKKGQDATNQAEVERSNSEGDMFWKRRQNWEADLAGTKANKDEAIRASSLSDCSPVTGGEMRFRTLRGKCIPAKFASQLRQLRASGVLLQQRGLDPRADEAGPIRPQDFQLLMNRTGGVWNASSPADLGELLQGKWGSDLYRFQHLSTRQQRLAQQQMDDTWAWVRNEIQGFEQRREADRLAHGMLNVGAAASTGILMDDAPTTSQQDVDVGDAAQVRMALEGGLELPMLSHGELLQVAAVAKTLPTKPARKAAFAKIRRAKAVHAQRFYERHHHRHASDFFQLLQSSASGGVEMDKVLPMLRAYGFGHDSCAHAHPLLNHSTVATAHSIGQLSSNSDRIRLFAALREGPTTLHGLRVGCTPDNRPVELPILRRNVYSHEERDELVRNITVHLNHVERAMNTTQTSAYWRGESEEFIIRETRRTLAEYRRQLEHTSTVMKQHHVDMKKVKLQLEALIRHESIDPDQVREAIKQALARFSKNNWDKGGLVSPFGNVSIPEFQAADEEPAAPATSLNRTLRVLSQATRIADAFHDALKPREPIQGITRDAETGEFRLALLQTESSSKLEQYALVKALDMLHEAHGEMMKRSVRSREFHLNVMEEDIAFEEEMLQEPRPPFVPHLQQTYQDDE